MAAGKVIGRVEVSIGNVRLIDVEGNPREVGFEGRMYEGEQIYSDNPDALFQIKYSGLPEATAYDGVFRVFADGSVVSGLDGNENLFGDDIDFMDTAAGGGMEASSAFLEEVGEEDDPSLLGFDRGADDTGFGEGITDFGIGNGTDDQTPPVILSDNDAIYDENNTDVVMQVSVYDTSSYTFAIDGLDSALFTIDPITGEVRFVDSPDFENPQDIGGDNEYNFYVTVTDASGNYTTQLISINVNNVNEAPVAVDDSVGEGDLVYENDTTTIDVLANDTDVDADDNPSNFILNDVTITTNAHSEGYDASEVDTAAIVSVVDNKLEFNPGSEFDYLAIGDTATVVVTYEMQDDEGLTSTATVTILITGTNDQPDVSEVKDVEVFEALNGQNTNVFPGLLLVEDIDHDDTHTFHLGLPEDNDIEYLTSEALEGSRRDSDSIRATVVATDDVTGEVLDTNFNAWITMLDEDTGEFQISGSFNHLAVDETATVTFYYYAVDNQGMDGEDGINETSTSEPQLVTITIIGTNDQPEIENIRVGSVLEARDGDTPGELTTISGSFEGYYEDQDDTDEHEFIIVSTPEGFSGGGDDGDRSEAISSSQPNYGWRYIEIDVNPESDNPYTAMIWVNSHGVNIDFSDVYMIVENGEFQLVGDFDALSVYDNLDIKVSYQAQDDSGVGIGDDNNESSISDTAWIMMSVEGTNDQPVVRYEIEDSYLESAQTGNQSDTNTFIVGTLIADDDDLSDMHSFDVLSYSASEYYDHGGPGYNNEEGLVAFDRYVDFYKKGSNGNSEEVTMMIKSTDVDARELDIKSITLLDNKPESNSDDTPNSTDFKIVGNFNALAAGEEATITFQFVASDRLGLDGSGADEASKSDPLLVTITIIGTNDQPEVKNINVNNILSNDGPIDVVDDNPDTDTNMQILSDGTVLETADTDDSDGDNTDDATSRFVAVLDTVTDEDISDNHVYQIYTDTPDASVSIYAVLNDGTELSADEILAITDFDYTTIANWEYKIEGDFNYIPAGDELTISFDYVAIDNSIGSEEANESDPKTISLTITGTNDRPEVAPVGFDINETYDADPSDGSKDDSLVLISRADEARLYATDEDNGDTHFFDIVNMPGLQNGQTSAPLNGNGNDEHLIIRDAVEFYQNGRGSNNETSGDDYGPSYINPHSPLIRYVHIETDANIANHLDVFSIAFYDNNGGDNSVKFDLEGDFTALAAGETATITFMYTADDGSDDANGETSLSEAQMVTITITGTNDRPVVTSFNVTLSETIDSDIPDVDQTKGQVDDVLTEYSAVLDTVSDDDVSDMKNEVHTYHIDTTELVAKDASGNEITLYDANGVELDASELVSIDYINGEWIYSLSGDFNNLADGESAVVTINYYADDHADTTNGESNISETETITLTITGTNDRPEVDRYVKATVVETSDIDNDSDISDEDVDTVFTAQLVVTDRDLSNNHAFDIEPINENNNFVDKKTSDTADIQQLITDDGYRVIATSESIDVSALSISSIVIGNYANDKDFGVDDGDNAVTTTTADITITGNFNALGIGETATIFVKYTADDGEANPENSTSKPGYIAVTVEGTNDQPEVIEVNADFDENYGSDIAGGYDIFTDNFLGSDDDANAQLTYSVISMDAPTFTDDSTILVDYFVDGLLEGQVYIKVTAGNPSLDLSDIEITGINVVGDEFSLRGNFDPLPLDEVLTIKFLYNADDGTDARIDYDDETNISNTETVTLTVTGTNDGADIFGIAEHYIDEDETNPISGQLFIREDLDAGEEFFTENLDVTMESSDTYTNALGTLSIDSDGIWSYTLNHTDTAVDEQINSLDDGERVVETYVVTSVDGTEFVLTINIDGEEDVTVVVNDTKSAAEDTAEVIGNVLVNDYDVDTSDTPLSVVSFSIFGDFTTYLAGTEATINGVGTLSIDALGDYIFIPVADWNGVVPQVTYELQTGSTGTLTITIDAVNDAPVIVENQTFDVDENSSFIGQVVASDIDSSPLTYSLVDSLGNALVSTIFEIDGNGNITVKAGETLDYEDTDSHTLHVKVEDSDGLSDIEEVNVTVNNLIDTIPDAPIITKATGNDDGDYVTIRGTYTVPDNDGLDGIRVLVTDSFGNVTTMALEVVLNANGTFVYTFAGLLDSGDVVTLEAYNDAGSSTSNAVVYMIGTDVNDTFIGNDPSTVYVLDGDKGDDVLSGSDRGDLIYGGKGDDIIDGGAGNDTIFGGRGDDIIHGGSWADTIDGGKGSDAIYGDQGSDTIIYDSADSVIDGGRGYDINKVDTLVIQDGDTLNLDNVNGIITNFEKIELGDGASILGTMDIDDVLEIIGGTNDDGVSKTLIIEGNDTNSVTLDNTFTEGTTAGGFTTYTATSGGDTVILTIEDTIDVY